MGLRPTWRRPRSRASSSSPPEQARARFDELARLTLGISGAEFARRWEAGQYAADPEAVVELAVLLPMAR